MVESGSETASESASTCTADHAPAPTHQLDLSQLPPIFVLPTHLTAAELHDVESKLAADNARLADIKGAGIVLGAVGTRRRAQLELRSRQVWTRDVGVTAGAGQIDGTEERRDVERARKRRRVEDLDIERKDPGMVEGSSTESEVGSQSHVHTPVATVENGYADGTAPALNRDGKRGRTLDVGSTALVKVVKLNWLKDAERLGRTLPIDDYVVYVGELEDRPHTPATSRPQTPPRSNASPQAAKTPSSHHSRSDGSRVVAHDILERAKADPPALPSRYRVEGPRRRFGRRAQNATTHHALHEPPKLLQQNTSDVEGSVGEIPDPPDWVKRKVKYACQRTSTPPFANVDFIAELQKIKLGRTLTLDEIGVRAYSTSIAAIAAYPHVINSTREILSLPGCDNKIASLWVEWKHEGTVKAAEEVDNDSVMQGLRLFYEIWGVGAKSAREFYFDRGWRDLDDVIEYGWSALSRVQQIGVKFYDEFLDRIPRPEVESIAAIIHEHGRRVRDAGVECIIVGGYRRGKETSGDVDVILSHRDLEATKNLVTDVVTSLEEAEYITHTLTLSLANTKRNQFAVAMRNLNRRAGAGFDTLDKALLVWQDPAWPTREADLARDPRAKNPAVHRRVDIIIAPWRSVGCAIVGWSGDTTFERDLRRYAKHMRNWKFDSSGVRDRSDGSVVELEGPEGVEGSWREAERRVFEGMGLEFREPWERLHG